MEKFIKLCKICEIILNNDRVCKRCGRSHGAPALDGLTCRDCYKKYYNTPIYEKMKKLEEIRKKEEAMERFQRVLGGAGFNLEILTPREREILIMRFGLEDGVGHFLEEVGKKFRITKERIRQIEAKALERLREGLRT